MKSLLLVCSALLVLGASQARKPRCGRNEEWRQCRGCETTCAQALQGEPLLCPAVCRPPGCQCESGYYRNEQGRCVSLKRCEKKKCGRNEEMKGCGACDTPCDLALLGQTRGCSEVCRPAECGCKNGFFRTATGKCVTKRQCSSNKACPKNEEMKLCGSCDTSCEVALRGETTFCTADCRPPKCGCKDGFYRNSEGRCVRKSQCTANDDVCAAATCPRGTKCEPINVVCKKLPCPKFSCVPIDEPRCRDGSPFFGSQNQCARDPCPPGFHCEPHPLDKWAICCPDEDPLKDVCGKESGPPLPSHNCGRGGKPCPEGFFCKIHPADAYAVCCRETKKSECPAGHKEVPGSLCGGIGGLLCPPGQTCHGVGDHPDASGVCCTKETCPAGQSEVPGSICGGIAGLRCPEGQTCHGVGNYPDASGVCCIGEDPCAGVKCDDCEVCVPDPKNCFTTPCPQHQCIPTPGVNPCGSNPCGVGQVCHPSGCKNYACAAE